MDKLISITFYTIFFNFENFQWKLRKNASEFIQSSSKDCFLFFK